MRVSVTQNAGNKRPGNVFVFQRTSPPPNKNTPLKNKIELEEAEMYIKICLPFQSLYSRSN